MPKCGIKFPVYAIPKNVAFLIECKPLFWRCSMKNLSEKPFNFSRAITPVSSGKKIGHENDCSEANDCPERNTPAGFLNGFVHGDFLQPCCATLIISVLHNAVT